MFYGSVPAEAQAIMNKIVKTWEVSDVYVGCSGNFTLERFIGPMEKFRLHSNDVTMYSQCLAAYYMREHVPLELSEAGLEQFPWLTEYMQTDSDKIATMLLCSRLVAFTDKGENPYYNMMLEESIRQFPTMHEKTVWKVEKNALSIASYFNGDALEFAKQAPEDAGFVSFPPFKKAGKAYAKDFAKLESLFKFEPPEYTFFNEDVLKDYFREIMKKKDWCFATEISGSRKMSLRNTSRG